jgi:hypothetical protein
MLNPGACEITDWCMPPKDHCYYKEMVALIMAARISGQPFLFSPEGCAKNMRTIVHVVSDK